MSGRSSSRSSRDDPHAPAQCQPRPRRVVVWGRAGRVAAWTALVLACAGTLAAGPQPAREAALRWIPNQALAVVVLEAPDVQVARLRDWWNRQPSIAKRAEAQLQQNPELLAARMMLTGFAAGLGVDPWQLVAGLLGRQIAIGLAPGNGDQPHMVLVSLTRDRALRDRALEQFHLVTGLVRDGQPDPERSRALDGVRVFAVSDNLYHCVIGDALIITNSRPAMRAVLELRTNPAGSLATSEALIRARESVPPDAAAWVWADAARLREALTAGDGLPEKMEDLGAALLLGSLYHAARTGETLLAWLRSDHGTLHAELRLTGVPRPRGSFAAFAPRAATQRDWDPARLAGYLGSLELTRDWTRLFADREALLAPQAASDLADAAVTFTTFFGGLDFVEQVLPRLSPRLRIVAVRRGFSAGEVVPVPRLPAFALVARLRHANRTFVQRLYSAASSALTIISVDMAQQGEPSWLLDVDRYRGTRIVLTRYAEPAEDDDAATTAETRPASQQGDARYNFTPAVAVAKNHFILATSRELLEDIIDTLSEGVGQAAARTERARASLERVELRVAPLVALLRDNRRELIANRMLEEDLPREKAAAQIDTFLELLGLVRGGSIETGFDEQQWWAKAELQMSNGKETVTEPQLPLPPLAVCIPTRITVASGLRARRMTTSAEGVGHRGPTLRVLRQPQMTRRRHGGTK